ncbi:prohibitin family protein [Anaerotignum sp.]|uniref:prohibitin family protein n=1 Tax=Anaerotignum sp. TaxID=2039241 RepID=UPI0027152F50|nr:prohibitin family protein [Anaerotignum sp.]
MKGKIGAIVLGVVLIVGGLCAYACLERIPTGYVGVVYSMSGGVNGELLTQGFHLVSPTKRVKEFSVGNEQLILSADSREGSEVDESFAVSTSDKANIKISFQMSYRYEIDKVVDTYKQFKGMSGADIVNQRVRTVLKAKISEATNKYTMMDIYSGNRGEINATITKILNDELGSKFGIEVIDASIIDVHPDAQLEQAIKDKVTAMQKKQQAEAEQETVKVEAETKLIKAQNEAEIAITKANAEAEANRVLAQSITQELIDMKEAEARLEHGWITVQGGQAIVDARE